MGLIDRAKDDQFAKLIRDGEEAEAQEQNELKLERHRVQIVTRRLEVVATNLEEPLVALTKSPVGMPRYYVLGDIVIMVQRFLNGKSMPDPSKPNLMCFSYCTYLVGLDTDKRLTTRKIGTLSLLDYAGIAKAITDAPPGVVFSAEAVKIYLQ